MLGAASTGASALGRAPRGKFAATRAVSCLPDNAGWRGGYFAATTFWENSTAARSTSPIASLM
jgi:hypothetical protein